MYFSQPIALLHHIGEHWIDGNDGIGFTDHQTLDQHEKGDIDPTAMWVAQREECVRAPDIGWQPTAVSVAMRPEKPLNIQRMAGRLVSIAISVSARIGKKTVANAIPARRLKAGKAASQRRKNQTPDIALFFNRMV